MYIHVHYSTIPLTESPCYSYKVSSDGPGRTDLVTSEGPGRKDSVTSEGPGRADWVTVEASGRVGSKELAFSKFFLAYFFFSQFLRQVSRNFLTIAKNSYMSHIQQEN